MPSEGGVGWVTAAGQKVMPMRNPKLGKERAAIKRGEAEMTPPGYKERSDTWAERLSLAICLWLCVTPFIFFLAVLFFDLRVASASTVVSLVIILLVCNAICRFRLYERKTNG